MATGRIINMNIPRVDMGGNKLGQRQVLNLGGGVRLQNNMKLNVISGDDKLKHVMKDKIENRRMEEVKRVQAAKANEQVRKAIDDIRMNKEGVPKDMEKRARVIPTVHKIPSINRVVMNNPVLRQPMVKIINNKAIEKKLLSTQPIMRQPIMNQAIINQPTNVFYRQPIKLSAQAVRLKQGQSVNRPATSQIPVIEGDMKGVLKPVINNVITKGVSSRLPMYKIPTASMQREVAKPIVERMPLKATRTVENLDVKVKEKPYIPVYKDTNLRVALKKTRFKMPDEKTMISSEKWAKIRHDKETKARREYNFLTRYDEGPSLYIPRNNYRKLSMATRQGLTIQNRRLTEEEQVDWRMKDEDNANWKFIKGLGGKAISMFGLGLLNYYVPPALKIPVQMLGEYLIHHA